MHDRESQLRRQFESGGIAYVLAGCSTEPMIEMALAEYAAYEALQMGGMPSHHIVRQQVRSGIDFLISYRSDADSNYNSATDPQIKLFEQAYNKL